jgi:tetratricopeptide (TPR) repeat protein
MVYEGDALSTANEAEPAYALYQESMAIRAKLWGPQSVKLARERYQLAIGLWSQGRLQQALKELKQAEQDMSTAMGPEHTNTLVIALQRSRLEVQVNMSTQGLARLLRIVDLLVQRKVQIDPRTLFDAVHAAGESLQMSGDLGKAQRYLQQALDLSRSLRGRLPQAGLAESDLASNLQDLGDYEGARKLLREAIDMTSKAYSPDHPYVKTLQFNLLSVDIAEAQASGRSLPTVMPQDMTPPLLVSQGKTKEALQVALSRWDTLRRASRADQLAMSVYIVHDQLARAYAASGRCVDAIPHFHAALDAMSNAHRSSPYLMLTRARLLDCDVILGQHEEARELRRLVAERLRSSPRLGPHFLLEADKILQRGAEPSNGQ